MYLLKIYVLIIFYSVVESYPAESNMLDADQLLISENLLECELNCPPLNQPVKIIYHLYTRKNPSTAKIIVPLDENAIKTSNFNSKNPSRFITHGWNSGPNSDIDNLLVNALLKKGDFNVFFVEWTSCAQQVNYFKARCCVENVGIQVADYLDFLNTHFKLNYDKLVLTGHSLGAHVMGHAGKNVQNGKVKTIVGLDPAKPCFKTDLTQERLAKSDAFYVETIHTNGNGLGYMTPIGHASFYPNWGKLQKGCVPFPISRCSHSLAYKFYAESILENNFIATKCDDYDELLDKDCSTETDIRMGGEPTNQIKQAAGIFYVATNRKEPYGTA